MHDDPRDGTDFVVGVITERIEAHFGMPLDRLRDAVAADPAARPAATEVVSWHGLLVDAQAVLDRAENDLLAALDTQPSEVDDPTLGLAFRVDAAVSVRDGRAMVVRWLLDPDAHGQTGVAAQRLTRLRARTHQGPALPTSPAARPAVSAVAPAARRAPR
ncbi:hypothetical protein ACFYVL_09215 [Streptomyces sp. NPDC004111]|uniref:hypothetical protein n=1 Tax=Streptomyces sp. NPDC004111 TaxID=3364690 RepID=UPI0036C94862